MFISTLSVIQCPCSGTLELIRGDQKPDIQSGLLQCQKCQSTFPILGGVAVVVEDVGLYLAVHAKGISKLVPDQAIPAEYLGDYLEAKEALELEHIDEDLESERVNSLYLIGHYLRAANNGTTPPWWGPLEGEGSPLIDRLIRENWDTGPFAQIRKWIEETYKASTPPRTIELGCGVGGLLPLLSPHLKSYLGVDSSFASIAIARHLALGAPYPSPLLIPNDLLQGSVSRAVPLPAPASFQGEADFIVGDLEALPVKNQCWDLSIALNAMDMLDDPASLPELQLALLTKEGRAVQSCPYIWHESVAKQLRSELPADIRQSSAAVEYLYSREGFEILKSIENLPWLFFKHVRQLEIYSVHLFLAKPRDQG